MSESVSSNAQEEYEDDFEKDLDWLISEESKSQEQDEEDIEAQINRELGEDREEKGADEGRGKIFVDDDPEEERWPTPLDPLEGVLDDSKDQDDEEEKDEEKRSILQKIEQANRQLQDQEAPDETRHRRLHFKDTLVDLVVPANDYPIIIPSGSEASGSADVSGHMQRLKITSQEDSDAPDRAREGAKEGRVLVEKDGKFDLVSLKEVESQGLLPPLSMPCTEDLPDTGKSPSPSPKLHSSSASSACSEPRYVPKPPARPRARPSSASHTLRAAMRHGTERRVRSASGVTSHATFFLSPQQKELLTKQQLKKDRLAREEEERRLEEEEQKRQENDLAFRTWLLKKRQQLHEDRRVQRAQEMERMSGKVRRLASSRLSNVTEASENAAAVPVSPPDPAQRRDCCDPDQAFKLWMQKKQEQQLKERQLEEMRRLELESSGYLHRPEECEKAFKLWLRRKRLEKRLEQQAARERSRRMLMEERRSRRMQDLYYPINEIRSFRFTEPYAYRF